ncbi:hypothetical protein MUK42_11631 [Musa troglodytarum]|uniref:Zinc-ribbon domain-containing protein n=2 Tax=Musa troglodytarum TaxID=320322 RepID=A0A9E7GR01_9LILI|nr:hypothetical protein MUK42_11631 [Musa troglodytarum]
MAEEGLGSKVRVVRCPKCEKLLPEVANFAVYRCGGCGATLQAKKPVPGSGASPEKSDEENIKYLEVLEQHCTEKKPMVSDSSAEIHHEGSGADRTMESLSHGSAGSHGVSVTGCKDSDLMKIDDLPKENGGADTMHQCHWETLISEHTHDVSELGKTDMESGREMKQQVDESREPQRRQVRAPRAPMGDVCPAPLPDEGPSDCHRYPSYINGNVEGQSRQNMDGSSRVVYLEQDRARLLRMLDELRDQVQRTCEASDKPKSSYVHHDHVKWFPETSSSSDPNSSRYFPTLHDHNAGMVNLYSNVPAEGDIPGYGDPFAQRRVPVHRPREYPPGQVDGFLYGQFALDPVVSYHHDGFYHHPACSCLQCYQRPFLFPARAPSTTIGHQRILYPVNNYEFYGIDGPSIIGSRNSNIRVDNAPLHRLEPRSHCRTKFSKNNARSCRPIDGAAPFTICSSCFELLQLPERSFLLKRNNINLQCGSCFKLVAIQYDGSKIVISAPTPVSRVSSENNNSSHNSTINGIQSNDEKLVLPYIFTSNDHEMIEKGLGLHSRESEKEYGSSLSPGTSGYVESPESVILQKDVPSLPGMPSEAQVMSGVPSLPLREHFGYLLSDHAADGSESGSESNRSDQVRSTSLNGNFKQNSTKDVQVATEMDLSDEEDPPSGLSRDSWDMISKDETQPRIIKAGDSFLAGLIKKSFRPLNQSLGHSRFKVSINDHPIPDRLIKKAEKLAGPIYPGHYWYDYRAGFWGVMGNPCLGIISPFIKEFNYPMPKNCAGGNTGVLVNGRELHQKDLDLLVGRGLPATRGCSYIIEISGKVWDESSGEELDGLGKLAPTVEKVKHGFGMRVQL